MTDQELRQQALEALEAHIPHVYKDRGHAFPVSHDMALIAGLQNAYGMTLRDYFAAKALQGMLAGFPDADGAYKLALVEAAYRFADAMLKARGQ